MATQFLVSTTGTAASVVLDDLGGITLTHPTVDRDLVPEIGLDAIAQLAGSAQLAAAVAAGHLTVTDENSNPITDPGAALDYVTQAELDSVSQVASQGVSDAAAAQADIDGHEVLTNNPHSTSVGNLGSGTLAQLNSKITNATLDDASSPRNPNVHASAHHAGQDDALSHDSIAGAGSNSHFQLDQHVSSILNPHSVTIKQTGGKSVYCAFVRHMLEVMRDYTTAQITAGLIDELYEAEGDLPATPPTSTSEPAFAVIDDGSPAGIKVAFWDFNAGGQQWIIVAYPWENPILVPGHIIRQDNTVGSGVTTFNYAMGPEILILNDCKISEFSVKVGAGGLQHAWAIRKSTVSGGSPPAMNTYTNVIASGIHTQVTANNWEVAQTGMSLNLSAKDWVVAHVFPGAGSGQNLQIAAARTAGDLLEDFGMMNAGTYVPVAGPNPGGTTVPTTRVTTVCYGLCSVKLEAQ